MIQYLKGVTYKPGLFVEIQFNQGQWRIEDRYPPQDMETISLELGGELMNRSWVQLQFYLMVTSGQSMKTEAFTEDIWISGLPRLHIDVSTATVGGQHMLY